jgi:hypothetical protein
MTAERGLLHGARVYLSGPMDFVASRDEEAKNGWRNRIGDVLRSLGAVVFDPWKKPDVRGLFEYGRENEASSRIREGWTYAPTKEGAAARHKITGHYWETLHIDLRMVDTCDFVIAFCPTNIYSVGTPHEIALARQQRKPVLFVSPPVVFPALEMLQKHLAEKNDDVGAKLLAQLEQEVPIKLNPKGVPSLWYMPLVGGESFFDGFGFDHGDYRARFEWTDTALDLAERGRTLQKPLLPALDELTSALPKKWSSQKQDWVRNDDWLVWDLKDGSEKGGAGATVDGAKGL